MNWRPHFVKANEISINTNTDSDVTLYANGKEWTLKPISRTGIKVVKLPKELSLENTVKYWLKSDVTKKVVVDAANILLSEKVNKEIFNYTGDLGTKATAKQTKFVVFAPLAQTVTLKYRVANTKIQTLELKKSKGGSFTALVKKSLHGAKYRFEAKLWDDSKMTFIDPHSTLISKDGEWSIAVNKEKIAKVKGNFPLNNAESVIYSVNLKAFAAGKFNSVKDMSSKFGDKKVRGIEYINKLGVTHIEIKDLTQALDGQFQAVNNDLVSADKGLDGIKELSNMIAYFGKRNIGTIANINVDPKLKAHPYAKLSTPHLLNNGYFNWSHKINQEFLINSLIALMKTYGLQGFRLENSESIPEELMVKISNKIKAAKPDSVVYFDDTKFIMTDKIRTIDNEFRERITGDGIKKKGIATGGDQDFKYLIRALEGETGNQGYLALNFISGKNEGLLEELTRMNKTENEATAQKRIRMANVILFASHGVPIIEMGQEIGLCAKNFSWTKLEKNKPAVKFLTELVAIRKMLAKVWYKPCEFKLVSNGNYLVQTYKGLNNIIGHDAMKVIYNTSSAEYFATFETPFIPIFDGDGVNNSKEVLMETTIAPHSINMFIELPSKQVTLETMGSVQKKNLKKLKLADDVLSNKDDAAANAKKNIRKTKFKVVTIAKKQANKAKKLNLSSDVLENKASAAADAKVNQKSTKFRVETIAKKQAKKAKKLKMKRYKD